MMIHDHPALFSIMFHHFHNGDEFKASQGSISRNDLVEIIVYLKRQYNLIGASEYQAKVLENSLEDKDACLSFDDALKSQLVIALPLLDEFRIESFFFVYSEAFSENPPLLEFCRDFRHTFNGIDHYYQNFFKVMKLQYPNDFQKGEASFPATFLEEYPFYSDNDRKYRFFRDRILKDRYAECVQAMMEDTGYSLEKARDRLFMTTDDLVNIHSRGHRIGMHSASHPTRMHELSYTQQTKEYRDNSDFLSGLLGEPISSMSHPCGNYNSDTLTILKDLGIRIGFRSSLSHTSIASNLEIPREDHTNLLNRILP